MLRCFTPIEDCHHPCMEISQEHTTDVCWTGISIFSQLVMNGPGWMLDLLYRARCWVVFLFADMTDVIFLFPGP